MAGCSSKPNALDQDVYIWQRQWLPELIQAAKRAEHSSTVTRWRILAGEFDAKGRLYPAHVMLREVKHLNRPTIMVVRIDGQLSQLNLSLLQYQIVQLIQKWQADGLSISGLEIDYDCGSHMLIGYASFLASLRTQLAKGMPLTVTALPDWLHFPDAFKALLHQVDGYVLQVHAVQNPHAGLINTQQTLQWIRLADQLSLTSFRVALPNYGSLVSWNEAGQMVGIESERPDAVIASDTKELIAIPAEMSELINMVNHSPPSHLVGFTWFRLPMESDRRTWSETTWQAVMEGRYHSPKIEVVMQSNNRNQAFNVMLVNHSLFDGVLPERIVVSPWCDVGDGANGYFFKGPSVGFARHQTGLLRANTTRVVGWLRCKHA